MTKRKKHLQNALQTCGYPDWPLKKTEVQKKNRKEINREKGENQYKGQLVINYIVVSQRVDRVLKIKWARLYDLKGRQGVEDKQSGHDYMT